MLALKTSTDKPHCFLDKQNLFLAPKCYTILEGKDGSFFMSVFKGNNNFCYIFLGQPPTHHPFVRSWPES